jgi:hypothetical protein
MNGRIYDPIVGQFMQADNVIQSPEDFISYNRYSYCLFNPFKYTDPSGEEFLGEIISTVPYNKDWGANMGPSYNPAGFPVDDEVVTSDGPVVPYTPLIDCSPYDYSENWFQFPLMRNMNNYPCQITTNVRGGGGGNIYVSKDKTLNLNQEVRKGDRIDVSDKNGNYIGWVEVVDYTRTKDGLNIIIDFYQFGTDVAKYIREGQTIRTNDSNDPHKATTYNDPSKNQKDLFDNLPYYWTNELQRKYNRPVGGLARSRFGDGPSRDDKYQSNRETWWFAELSFFNVTSNSDIPLITFTYGFFYFNGVTCLYPLMIISPSEAHLSYFRK